MTRSPAMPCELPSYRPYVEDSGAGTPVLCLHGIGSSSQSFAAQVAGLSDRLRLLCWDAPGYGRSPDAPTEPDMNWYADVAAGVITDRVPSAHVMGASWGGVIATRLALRHPALVRSLILVDSTRGSGTDEQRAAAMHDRIARLARLGPAAFAATAGPRLVSRHADNALSERVIRLMAEAVRLPGYSSAARSMAATDHTEALASVTVPTLVVVGREDVVTGLAESERLACGIRGADLVVLAGAGHVSNQEAATRFNQFVVSYILGVEASRAADIPLAPERK